jgi:hypothetical protein
LSIASLNLPLSVKPNTNDDIESATITQRIPSFHKELKAIDTLNLVIIPNLVNGFLILREIKLDLNSLPDFIKSTVFSLNNQKVAIIETPVKIMNGTTIATTKDNQLNATTGVGNIQ